METRNKIRRLTRLAWCIAAQVDPPCDISQSPLVRRYRDINYGLTIECSSARAAQQVRSAVKARFALEGYLVYTADIRGKTLDLAGYYAC